MSCACFLPLVDACGQSRRGSDIYGGAETGLVPSHPELRVENFIKDMSLLLGLFWQVANAREGATQGESLEAFNEFYREYEFIKDSGALTGALKKSEMRLLYQDCLDCFMRLVYPYTENRNKTSEFKFYETLCSVNNRTPYASAATDISWAILFAVMSLAIYSLAGEILIIGAMFVLPLIWHGLQRKLEREPEGDISQLVHGNSHKTKLEGIIKTCVPRGEFQAPEEYDSTLEALERHVANHLVFADTSFVFNMCYWAQFAAILAEFALVLLFAGETSEILPNFIYYSSFISGMLGNLLALGTLSYQWHFNR